MKRYNDFPSWFRNRFSGRVQKVSVNAGFTCPNRDGTKGRGGCTYCNNQTFSPAYCASPDKVTRQIDQGIRFFEKKYKSIRYLAYFQSYTSTYAPFDRLKELYEEALSHPKIIGGVISTRPDAVEERLLDYLAEKSRKFYIMIEFGVESHLDRTLSAVNRGHSFADSVRALEETARRGINTCAHLMLGLPGETRTDWLEQARVISTLPVNTVKLHQLQIHEGTVMAGLYRQNPGQFSLFEVDDYIELVVDYLERLNPAIVVERFISQAPPEMLIAPRWGLKNFEFVDKVKKRLKERDTWQGRLFTP